MLDASRNRSDDDIADAEAELASMREKLRRNIAAIEANPDAGQELIDELTEEVLDAAKAINDLDPQEEPRAEDDAQGPQEEPQEPAEPQEAQEPTEETADPEAARARYSGA